MSEKGRLRARLQAEGRKPLVREAGDRIRSGVLEVMKDHALLLERDACGEERGGSRNERAKAAAEYANGLLEAAARPDLSLEGKPLERGDRIAGALYLAVAQGLHWAPQRNKDAGRRAELVGAGVQGVLNNLR
ncbi:MAG: hypothetical protein LBW85_09425, partial [Deltaproteobacteria bacterium]|nr:hypothetical protein [Deltaproteobacteria bacterium]